MNKALIVLAWADQSSNRHLCNDYPQVNGMTSIYSKFEASQLLVQSSFIRVYPTININP